MANARFYSSTAQATTLNGAINNSTTAVVVNGTTGFPSVPFVLALDYEAATEELVLVTATAGFTLTVTRGFDGTSAQSHSDGAAVRHVVCADDLTDFRTHEDASTGVHGVTGSVVGTSDTQTLTNKTLTSPTVNGATVSGTVAGSPTFSGSPVFTGTPDFQTAITFTANGRIAMTPTGTANSPLLINGPAALSPPLVLVQRNSVEKFAVGADGDAVMSGTNTALVGLTVNTASGQTADILKLRNNSVDKFTVSPAGNAAVAGTLNVTGATTLTGAATLSSTLAVTGNTTLSGDLTVSGIGQFQFARVTSDVTVNNTTTLANITGLSFTVVAGATYVLDGWIVYNVNNTADIKFGWTLPATTTMGWGLVAPSHVDAEQNSSGRTAYNRYVSATGAQTIFYGGGFGGNDIPTLASAIIRPTNNGTVQMQFAQSNVDASDAIIRANSWLRLHRVA